MQECIHLGTLLFCKIKFLAKLCLTKKLCEPVGLVVVFDSDGACVEKDKDDYKPEPGWGLRTIIDGNI